MSTFKKAFLGISLVLLSLNAFSFLRADYLAEIVNRQRKESLIAEDIRVLDARKYLTSNKDQLSLNIFLSEVPVLGFAHPLSFSRIPYFSALSNHKALANIYTVLGFDNAINYNLDTANSYFIKALDQHILLENHQEVALISQNLSWINYIIGNLDSSLQFSSKAILALNNSPNKKSLFRLLSWQNNVLLALGRARDVEQKILKQGLIIASRNNSKIQKWECYYQLGKAYLLQNKMVQAKWFFIQALTLAEGFKSKTLKIKSLIMLAKAKSRTKDYSLALQNLHTANGLAQNANEIFKVDVAKQYADVYHSAGNLVKEQQYLSLYNRLKNTALNNIK